MSEDRRPSERCPSVPFIKNGTRDNTPAPAGQRWDSVGQVNLKSLAAKVLSRSASGTNGGTGVGQSCPTVPQSCPIEIEATDDPLFDSMRRLEVANISIA